MSRVRCAGITASGLRCARKLEEPATLCHAHEPGGHDAQLVLGKAGGLASARRREDMKRSVIDRLRDLEDVNRAVERAAAMVCRRSDPEATRRAGVLLAAAREARELIKVRDLERRLATLESADDGTPDTGGAR